jgi:hypothetical protein
MEYIFLPEKNADTYTDSRDIYNKVNQINKSNTLVYICYHISYIDEYPFLQIMLNKVCNNNSNNVDNIKEEFVLPSIIVDNERNSISELLITDVKSYLQKIHCDSSSLSLDAYKGIIHDGENMYALVNISNLDIKYLYLPAKIKTWFVLTTEIINIKSVCNIPISEMITNLFINNPELGILRKPSLTTIYSCPDVVYTGSDYKKSELNVIFGPDKTILYDIDIPYYPFFDTFGNAVMAGGWLQSYENIVVSNQINLFNYQKKLIDNKYGRYVTGGITRYALFMKTSVNIVHDIFDIDSISMYSLADSIIIQSSKNDFGPNILVKKFEQFVPISYHMLDKNTLGEQYNYNKHDEYTIV